jgi:uncharacterized membrane-anchored protein YitT (DUF2179 family)
MKKINFRNVADYFLIYFGTIIMALGLIGFLLPNKITTGGIAGIATIVYYFLHIPAGITILVVNIPLLFAGLRLFGKKFGIRTFVGILFFSLNTDLLDKILQLEPMTNNITLASIYGGLLIGTGLGFVFKGRGTTGGSDIIARIMTRYTNLSLGHSFMVTDFVIISSLGIYFGDMDLILFSLISLFASTKILDAVLEGMGQIKAVYIVSDKWEKIGDRINKELDRGVTVFISMGMYTRKERKTIFCVVTRRQVEFIRRLAKQEDPKAFVILFDAFHLMGEGFKERTVLFD